MQTVDADAAGSAAARPAQAPGGLQVARWGCGALGRHLRSLTLFFLRVCRQKRSMGLTLAEDQLSRLDSEPGKELSDRECSCAEHILSKIEDVL